MEDYKVLITSAGLGTRIKSLCKNLNKSLITINHKPIISHIIEKFPKSVEIILAVGYKKEVIKDYIEAVYDDRRITVVEIDKFDGDGSGLGYTILQCQKHIDRPFVFITNDTLVLDEIPPPSFNWVGYGQTNNAANYRKLKICNGKCVALLDKKSTFNIPYIGLCGIYDHARFFNIMNSGKNFGAIYEGESFALKQLIADGNVQAVEFDWYDTGDVQGVKKARQLLNSDDKSILEKSNEDIWFANGKVVKYSEDESFISNRVKRYQTINKFVPPITYSSKNIFAYKQVSGVTLSQSLTVKSFSRFLNYIQEFWNQPLDNTNEEIDCRTFYKDKSESRVRGFLNRFSERDNNSLINGEEIPSLQHIFKLIDWDYLCKPTPALVHGDLHFENILIQEDGNFKLLDWRQGFDSSLNRFDLYYDLAKLLHGILISHKVIDKQLYNTNINDNSINVNVFVPYLNMECYFIFKEFIKQQNLDWKKVEILTGLIYLNNASLHDDEYAKFLFYFGKYFLWKVINDKV